MTVGKQIAKGAAWLVVTRIVDRIIGFASTLVLARLLLPDDFGVVSMAMTIVALLDVLTDFGFEWSIIQRQSRAEQDLNTAWSLNVVVGILNGALLVTLIPVATTFYNEPRLQGPMLLLALTVALGGFRNVGMTLFELNLNFRPAFVLAFVRKVAGFVTTMTIALAYHSYWALVCGQAVAVVAVVGTSYALSPYRPRFQFASVRKIIQFSKWMYASNLLGYVNTRGVQLVIGRLAGAAPLGLYNMAYDLGNLASSELVQPTIRALFSGFSRIGDDPEQLRSVVVGVFGLAALLALPASVGVYVLAEPIVLVLLGAKWIGAVPLLQAIAGFGALHAFLAPVGILSLATGMARFVIGLTFVNAIIAIPTFAILLNRTNLVSATIALLAIGFLCGLINLLVAMRRVSVSADCLWKGVWRPALGVLVMSGILQYASTPGWSTAEGSLTQFGRMVGMVALGALTYICTVGMLWTVAGRPDSAERHVVKVAGAMMRRVAPRAP